jgi:RNase P subunit RPR2
MRISTRYVKDMQDKSQKQTADNVVQGEGLFWECEKCGYQLAKYVKGRKFLRHLVSGDLRIYTDTNFVFTHCASCGHENFLTTNDVNSDEWKKSMSYYSELKFHLGGSFFSNPKKVKAVIGTLSAEGKELLRLWSSMPSVTFEELKKAWLKNAGGGSFEDLSMEILMKSDLLEKDFHERLGEPRGVDEFDENDKSIFGN